MHSLSFTSSTSVAPEESAFMTYAIGTRLDAASPGEVITLEEVPFTINVEVPHPDPNNAVALPEGEVLLNISVPHPDPTKPLTLVPVIPIGMRRSTIAVDIGSVGLFPPGKVEVNDHRVELGFAITFQKVQGKTVPKIILDLNHRKFKPPIDLPGLYVGLTRVKHGKNIRLVPPQPGSSLDYLKGFKRSRLLAGWFAGFQPNGTWNASVAGAALMDMKMAEQASTKSGRQGGNREGVGVSNSQGSGRGRGRGALSGAVGQRGRGARGGGRGGRGGAGGHGHIDSAADQHCAGSVTALPES